MRLKNAHAGVRVPLNISENACYSEGNHKYDGKTFGMLRISDTVGKPLVRLENFSSWGIKTPKHYHHPSSGLKLSSANPS